MSVIPPVPTLLPPSELVPPLPPLHSEASGAQPRLQASHAHHSHGGHRSERSARNHDRFHPYSRPSAALQVADHYNRHQQQTHEQRKRSPIYRMRNFNNWIKSVLISRAAKNCRPKAVLDMGCGKGGDLLKWGKARIQHYVGMDIADVSVEQAHGRWKEMRNNRFSAEFHALDCYQYPLSKKISPEQRFDVVSQQFCLHYAFETEAKAKQMVSNVADHLRPGGFWIGTLPDAYWITKKLRSVDGLSFGNSVYNIRFDQKDHYPTFGHRYIFHLEDVIESCPEYLVHFPTLARLAEERGLKLLKRTPFHNYYEDAVRSDPESVNLLERMRVVERGGDRLSDDEWEIAGRW
ncbi:mRNA capping enzyme-domain-containing protein [Thamnocephalis sphaerospora]|uniref:mRNA cap guanine-N(7) methyltransferase n=1 Tax=Thamnocephalis sphaerospora TaxID=78915 RepID=A0A4P9XXK1_9FUNG|nr:mRNA capping enzyme-domain-containing protein [Thamnocephalis sphaerospora]|eukprot:RKP10391.1 mRNA capping enzyme-domain-containing protein [Thamnocephalis sphaerospora]